MGNRYVMADPRYCVACKACMGACIAKHSVPDDAGFPRLKVIQVNELASAPVLCHQCEEAPCAAACPTGALFRDEENARIGVNMSLCIGCRSCVNACPFGAVDVVAAPQAFDLGGLSVGAASQASVIKCDRCVDRDNGPACVEACASHALRIMQREDDGSVHEVDGGVK